MELRETYRNTAFAIMTTQKGQVWCAMAEIALERTGPKLMVNQPLENIGVAYPSEQRAIAAVRDAVHFTIEHYQRTGRVPRQIPLGGPDGIVLRREHFVEPSIDEMIASEQYDEVKVKAMSSTARAQLGEDALRLFRESQEAYEALVKKARAAGEPTSPSHNPAIRMEQVRGRVLEGNVRMCGIDPYYIPAPPKAPPEIKDYMIDSWVRVCEAEAKVRAAEEVHETAKRNNSKDAYDLSLEVHFAQVRLHSVVTSARLACEGMSEDKIQHIRGLATAKYKNAY